MAEIAGAGVGDLGREDRHDRSVDMTMHHRHDVILDAVTVSFAFATDQHLGSNGIGLTSGELVLAMGLLEAAPDAVDGHFPELGLNRFQNIWIVDALHLGFEVCAYFKAAFNLLFPLLPDAAASVAGKARIPGVTVFVGTPELIAKIAAGFDGGGGGHGGGSAAATLPITAGCHGRPAEH